MSVVGLLTLQLHIEHAHSLKEKRHVLQGLKDRLRKRFNVSVAEVDGQDTWQASVVAVVMVSRDRQRVQNQHDCTAPRSAEPVGCVAMQSARHASKSVAVPHAFRQVSKASQSASASHAACSVSHRFMADTQLTHAVHSAEPRMAADGWRAYEPVLRLAERDNVYLTISDVHSRSDVGFPFRDMHEVIKRAIDAFGIDRCLWGTGYPGHLRVAHGWPPLADELRLVRGGLDWLTAAERASILGDNARRLYGYG